MFPVPQVIGLDLAKLGDPANHTGPDFLGQKAEISYEMTEPKKWIRSYTLTFAQEARWSFGGENTQNEVDLNLLGMNNDLWRLYADLGNNFSHLDIRELRGGPAIRIDNRYHAGLSIGSNPSRKTLIGHDQPARNPSIRGRCIQLQNA